MSYSKLVKTTDTNRYEVFCDYKKSCTLPCPCECKAYSDLEEFNLYDSESGRIVHKFFNNKSHFEHQHETYRNRTYLPDKIVDGNCSVRLDKVNLWDEKTFNCFIKCEGSVNTSSFKLTNNGFIKDLSMKKEGKKLYCRSDSVYPEPKVNWFTGVLPNMTNVTSSANTTIHLTKQLDYSMTSALDLSEFQNLHFPEIICTISAGGISKTSTWMEPWDRNHFAVVYSIGLFLLWLLLLVLICAQLRCNRRVQKRYLDTRGIEI